MKYLILPATAALLAGASAPALAQSSQPIIIESDDIETAQEGATAETDIQDRSVPGNDSDASLANADADADDSYRDTDRERPNDVDTDEGGMTPDDATAPSESRRAIDTMMNRSEAADTPTTQNQQEQEQEQEGPSASSPAGPETETDTATEAGVESEARETAATDTGTGADTAAERLNQQRLAEEREEDAEDMAAADRPGALQRAGNAVEEAARETGDAIENAATAATARTADALGMDDDRADRMAGVTKGDVISPKPGEFSVEALIGTAVMGPEDKKIGSVADVMLDGDGRFETVSLEVGGVLGLGAKAVPVVFDDLSIGFDREGEMTLDSGLRQSDIEGYEELSKDSADGMWRATELMEMEISLDGSEEGASDTARIADLIADQSDATITHVVAARGGIAGVGADRRAVEFGAVAFPARGDEDGKITLSAADFEAAPVFQSRKEWMARPANERQLDRMTTDPAMEEPLPAEDEGATALSPDPEPLEEDGAEAREAGDR